MKVELHQEPKVDKWLKRGIGVLALVASLGAATATMRSCGEFVDESWVTQKEVILIDNASMYTHKEEIQQQKFATSTDINHVVNVMIDEQIDDASLEIEKIDYLVARGAATPEDLEDKKLLKKAIIKSKGKIEPDGHVHGDG